MTVIGVADPAALWQLLTAGTDAVSAFPVTAGGTRDGSTTPA